MLALDTDRLSEACRDLGLDFVALFGSAARGTTRADSDVDLAVMGEATADPLEVTRVLSFRLMRGDLDVVWLPRASWLLGWEVAQVVAAIPPSDYHSSFSSMARTGWIDHQLAAHLAGWALVRNRLLHLGETVERDALQASIPRWRSYLRSVHGHLEAA